MESLNEIYYSYKNGQERQMVELFDEAMNGPPKRSFKEIMAILAPVCSPLDGRNMAIEYITIKTL